MPLTLDALRDPLRNPVPAPAASDDEFGIVDPKNDLDQWPRGHARVQVADNLTLKSISAYRTLDNLLYRMPTAIHCCRRRRSPAASTCSRPGAIPGEPELQALGSSLDGRLQYVAGLYYFRENNQQDTRSVVGLPAFITVPISLSGRFDLTSIAREEMTTDSYAAFASGTYGITDRLSLTAGLRYTRESKDFTNHVLLPNGTQQVVCINGTGAAPVQAAAAPCTPAQLALGYFTFTNQSAFDKTWDDVTPRVVLDYHLTDSALVYLSAAKGFKGGTTSGRDTRRCAT